MKITIPTAFKLQSTEDNFSYKMMTIFQLFLVSFFSSQNRNIKNIPQESVSNTAQKMKFSIEDFFNLWQ